MSTEKKLTTQEWFEKNKSWGTFFTTEQLVTLMEKYASEYSPNLKWNPIESAPTDGSEFLGLFKNAEDGQLWILIGSKYSHSFWATTWKARNHNSDGFSLWDNDHFLGWFPATGLLDLPSFSKTPKFKITEPGLYKFRNGEIVWVNRINTDEKYCVDGTFIDDEYDFMEDCWTIDGFIDAEEINDDLDIVAKLELK